VKILDSKLENSDETFSCGKQRNYTNLPCRLMKDGSEGKSFTDISPLGMKFVLLWEVSNM